MTTMAQFDRATQERAEAVLSSFTAMYRVSANLFAAEELGAAVKTALDGGSDDPGFTERLWDALLVHLHRRMADHAARGEDLPSQLDRRQYALLRKGLVARFGDLPAAAPELPDEEESEPDAPADTRSADERIAELLRARGDGGAPIDPAVAAILRR
jgi:hypothetical protein